LIDADTAYRFWRKADWVTEDAQRVFSLNEDTGHVVVQQSGVYLIYAQVGYPSTSLCGSLFDCLDPDSYSETCPMTSPLLLCINNVGLHRLLPLAFASSINSFERALVGLNPYVAIGGGGILPPDALFMLLL